VRDRLLHTARLTRHSNGASSLCHCRASAPPLPLVSPSPTLLPPLPLPLLLPVIGVNAVCGEAPRFALR
jgi:hypothetical protein